MNREFWLRLYLLSLGLSVGVVIGLRMGGGS